MILVHQATSYAVETFIGLGLFMPDMQDNPEFWTNRNLFSKHFILNRLEGTEEWENLDHSQVEDAFQNISDIYSEEMPELENRKEVPLEERFIRPVFQELDHYWEVQQSVQRNQRTPDYAFFESDQARQQAIQRKNRGEDVYKNAVGVGDAKRWGRNLDVEDTDLRDWGNPNFQIYYYLQETPPEWGILTNGKKWRLYYGPTSRKLNSFFEVDLQRIIENDDIDEFKKFYLLFRRQAFCPDSRDECFLDRVYNQSALFSKRLGEDIQGRIYEALKVLSQGFLDNPRNDLDYDDIETIHDSSLVYLYRLIFILYAESESRILLPVDSKKYIQDYSLNELKVEVCEELDKNDPKYRDYEFELWGKLDRLFKLLDKGSEHYNIPRSDFYIPAYNGGLFRTDPTQFDRFESQFLQDKTVADSYLAEVIRLISETDVQSADNHKYADYSSLSVRHLGSIYEGLLEYDLDVAEEPMVAIEEGNSERWISQSEFEEDIEDQSTREEGQVYFRTTKKEENVIRSYKPAGNERKEFGSYYTPEYVVQYIAEDSLQPVIEDIKQEVREEKPSDEYAEAVKERVFELSILDPAMGSGHFLTGVVDVLASEILEARQTQVDEEGVDSLDGNMDSEWVRRRVAQRCIYGIDIQPMAVELAKVSLWLNTLAAERPLAFLDHHLKTGNSLIGSNLEDIDELPIETDDEQTSWGTWGTNHREVVSHAIELFEDLLDIEMEDRADVKQMEEKYQEIQQDKDYQRIISICDVFTASELGVDIRSGTLENMARAMADDDEWDEITSNSWYQDAEDLRAKENFFHWYLEFPQVFYGGENNELGDPGGFDVVLGNPPYGSVDERLEDYLENKYSKTAEYFIDSFALFIEKGLSLLRKNGQFGYIIPQQWLTQPNAEELREFVLTNSWVRTIIRFEDRVFEGVDVDTIIMMAEKTDEVGIVNSYIVDNSADDVEEVPELELIRSTDQDQLMENDDYRIEIRRTAEEQRVLERIRASSVELDPRVADVRIGIQVYNSSKHSEKTRRNRAFHSSQKEDDDYFLEIKGRHVDRYHLDPSGAEYLKVGDHLHDSISLRFCSGPRILLQEITNESRHMLNAVYTDDEYCFDKSVLGIISGSKYEPQFLVAVINSEVMSWIFPRVSNKIISSFVTGSFPRIQVSDARKLPIPDIDFNPDSDVREQLHKNIVDTYNRALEGGETSQVDFELRGAVRSGHRDAVHDAVCVFAEDLGERYTEKKRLNTDLLSYIEPFEVEGTLQEIAQPVSGVEDSVLAEDGYEPQYKIIGFEVKEGPSSVTISVDVENEDSDSIETVEAFQLWDLDVLEVRLLKEFLPAALEKSEDKKYAGFLPHTTSRNSLLERLRDLEIPKLSDIETEFENYIERADREQELKRRIGLTERFIDETVCSLYGLNSENQEVIEKGLQKQED